MNHLNSTTTADLRYLNPTHFTHRFQIEQQLRGMGTNPEVISWFFTQFEELEADYTKQLTDERDARISDSDIQ